MNSESKTSAPGIGKRILALLLSLCMALALLPAAALAADGGLVDTSHIIDIYLNASNSEYDIDEVKADLIAQLVGQSKTWPDGSTTVLAEENIRFLTNVTVLDPSNLKDWYVYDHYDTEWYANKTAWLAGYNYSAPKTYNANGTPATYYTYAETESMRPYFGYTETYGSNTSILDKKNAGSLADLKNSSKLREHIYGYLADPTVKRASMIFTGYGVPANTDFLFYPTENSNDKEVTFKVNSANGNTHSMNGVGFLLNAGIDGSGYISGYVLYYLLSGDSNSISGCTSVTLYKIKDSVSAADFHGNSQFTAYATSVSNATVASPAWSTATTSIKLAISTTGVKVFHDSNGGTNYTQIGNDSTFSMEANGSNYGFGPLVQYSSHSCGSTSYFTFDDLEMKIIQSADSVLDPIYNSNYMQGTERYYVNLLESDQPSVIDADKAGLAVMNTERIRYVSDKANPFVTQLNNNGTTITAAGDNTAAKQDSVVSQTATYILRNNAWKATTITPTTPVASMALVTNGTTHSAAPEADTETPVDIILRHLETGAKVYAKDLATDVGGTPITGRSYTITPPGGVPRTITAANTAGAYTELFTVAADSAGGIYNVTQTVTYSGGTSTSTVNFFEVRTDTTAPTPSASVDTTYYTADITLANTASPAGSTYTSGLSGCYYVVNQSSNRPAAGDYTAISAPTTLSNVPLTNLATGTNYLHMFLKDQAGNVGYAVKNFTVTAFPVTYKGSPDTSDMKMPGRTLVLAGSTNTTPPTAGHSFIGWSTAENAAVAQYLPGGEYTLDSAITLYPVWKVVPQHTVTFDYSYPAGVSGQPVNGSQPVPEGTLAAMPQTPTTSITAASGDVYDFDGWYTEKTGGEKWVFAGNVVMGARTLYAHWVKRSNVTFDLNLGGVTPSGTTLTVPAAQRIVTGGKAAAPTAPGTWTGTDNITRVFDGWYTAGDDSGEKWSFTGYTITRDTRLYAHWIQKYNVSFAMNYPENTTSGTIAAPVSQTIEPGAKAAEPSLSAENRTILAGGYEYTFTGWYTAASGGDKWSFTVNTVNSSMTLYAQWSQKHTVSFELNYPDVPGKPTGAAAPEDQQVAHGGYVSDVTAPASWTAESGDGYYFAGWYTAAAAGELWYFSGRTVNSDMTLYARWSRDRYYTVSFDDNIGEPKDDYATVPTGKQLLATAALTGVADATRVDYDFGGWYKDAACRAAYDFRQTLGNNYTAGIEGTTVTLYAKWTARYDDSTDVEIATEALPDGTYKAFYSNYIEAADATVDEEVRVYRNFVVTNGALPEGLFLNSRTGEVYGVPTETGDFAVTVRMKNDEGTWISTAKTITLSIGKAALTVDGNTGISKTYGLADPMLRSDLLYVTDGNSDSTAILSAADASVSMAYDFDAQRAGYAGREIDLGNLAAMPDLDSRHAIPANSAYTDTLSLALARTPGEDAGVYKLYLTYDAVAGDGSYDVSISDELSSGELAYGGADGAALTTADKYLFTINKLSGVACTAAVPYGVYAPGGDVRAAAWTPSAALVDNAPIGVCDVLNSAVISGDNLSASGKLKPGTYTAASTIRNSADSLGTAAADTTANYDAPVFTLTIEAAELAPSAGTMSVIIGSALTLEKLQGLVELVGLVPGDKVGVTITSVVIDGTEYDDFTTDEFKAALAGVAKEPGSKPITIGYSNELTGADAENYSLASGGIVEAALTVYAGGGAAAASPESVPVIVDGVSYNIGTLEVEGDSATVIVDAEKLAEQLKKAKESVIVPIEANAKTSAAQLLVKDVQDMTDKGMALIIRTGGVDYLIPAKAIDTDSLLSALGADVPADVPVTVTVTQTGVKPEVADVTVVIPAVEFTAAAAYGGRISEITVFDRYTSRVVEVTAQQAAQITTAVVREADGSIRHVPTSVFQKDGKWYATAHSLTNSTYLFIFNEQSFADAQGKWYRDVVDEMASRKIVEGRASGVFDGDASITRAEFAAIVVRALGLPENGEASAFADVAAGAWYYGAVGKAYEYGLINGRGEGIFDPQANITRQEAMAMVHRAAAITELAGTSGSLAAFSDADSVSGWALKDAQWNVGSGLIQGNGAGMICGQDNITRGETAAVLLRLLQKSGLVDVRTKA